MELRAKYFAAVAAIVFAPLFAAAGASTANARARPPEFRSFRNLRRHPVRALRNPGDETVQGGDRRLSQSREPGNDAPG